jgi:hypothetical protein
MKKLLTLMTFVGLVFIYSCSEDEPKAIVEDKDPVASVLSAPVSGFSAVVTADNLAENLDFTWSAAEFPITVTISYDVQIDLSGGDFTAPTSLGTASATTLSVSYGDLNNTLIGTMSQVVNEAISLQVRVVASATGQDAIVSDPVAFTITTFEAEVVPTFANIWVAGAFQGWDNTNFISLTSPSDNSVYEGYLFFPEGQLEFKLYQNQNDWGEDSWGTDTNDGVMLVANCACSNFQAPAAGMYWVEIDITNLSYKLVPVSWGIIGDATPTGWDSDTDLVYNTETQALEITLDLVTAGSYKFRANDDWKQVFGVNSDGVLAYSDHLSYGNTEGINNITVPEDGNYTISLDLHNSNTYTFSAVKN